MGVERRTMPRSAAVLPGGLTSTARLPLPELSRCTVAVSDCPVPEPNPSTVPGQPQGALREPTTISAPGRS